MEYSKTAEPPSNASPLLQAPNDRSYQPMKIYFKAPAALLALALAAPCAALADDANGFGKLDPTQPAGITPEQIVARFGAREAEFAAARAQLLNPV